MAVIIYPIPQNFVLTDVVLNQKYVEATTSSIPDIKVYLDPFTNAAKEAGIPNTLVKIAKGAADFFVTLESSVPAKDFTSNCSTFAGIVKVFSVTKGIDDILVNADKKNEKGINLHQRNLGIASGFFQTIISGMAGVKLLDTFKVISLAQISEALGTTAVLPFAVVTNGIEIVKNIVDILSGSIKLHQTNVKDGNKRKYLKRFNTAANSQKIGDFLEKHRNKIITKQLSTLNTIENLKKKAAKRQVKAQDALNAYNTTFVELNKPGASNLRKFVEGIKLWRQEAALFKAVEAHNQIVEDYTNTNAKLDGRFSKLEFWTKAEAHFQDNQNKLKIDANKEIDMTDPLNQLIADKQIKWTPQIKNLKSDKWQEGIGIAINVISTIILIASTVLIFSGIGVIPVLLTITSLGLLISILGLGKTLMKKYTKPETVPPVDLANYIFAPLNY